MHYNILNILLGNRTLQLDVKWNFQYTPPFIEDTCYSVGKYLYAYLKAFKNPAIVHYMGVYKPWLKGFSELNIFRKEYFKYLRYTPWRFNNRNEENEYHKKSLRLKRLSFLKSFAYKIVHKPLLVFRRLYWSNVYLAFKTHMYCR